MFKFVDRDDIEYRGKARAAERALMDAMQSRKLLQEAAINRCLNNRAALAESELGLIYSCRQRLSMNLIISESQERWLFQVADRFPKDAESGEEMALSESATEAPRG